MHHRPYRPIGFELGLPTSQTSGPRADGALPAMMVSSFFRSVVSRSQPRATRSRPAGPNPTTH
jgi:hypothetical protein